MHFGTRKYSRRDAMNAQGGMAMHEEGAHPSKEKDIRVISSSRNRILSAGLVLIAFRYRCELG